MDEFFSYILWNTITDLQQKLSTVKYYKKRDFKKCLKSLKVSYRDCPETGPSMRLTASSLPHDITLSQLGKERQLS